MLQAFFFFFFYRKVTDPFSFQLFSPPPPPTSTSQSLSSIRRFMSYWGSLHCQNLQTVLELSVHSYCYVREGQCGVSVGAAGYGSRCQSPVNAEDMSELLSLECFGTCSTSIM